MGPPVGLDRCSTGLRNDRAAYGVFDECCEGAARNHNEIGEIYAKNVANGIDMHIS